MTADTIVLHESRRLDEAADMLRVVAHPARMLIIEMLDRDRRLNVTELLEALGMEQSMVSHHLSRMKDKGVVMQEREGKHVFYSLRHPKLVDIVRCVRDCCEKKS
jgi:ArsR family transcriptional regulator, virulence genes transcriptional regulator